MHSTIHPYSNYTNSPYVQRKKSNTYLHLPDSRQSNEKQQSTRAQSDSDAVSVEISNTARAKFEAASGIDSLLKDCTQALWEAADGFSDFTEKVTKGACKGYELKKYVSGYYRSQDVSAKDINLDAIDKMESIYQSYKAQIESAYEGEERSGHLAKLDAAYNAVFADKIIKPVKDAYDDKLDFFRPDSGDCTWQIHGSAEAIRQDLSTYITNQAYNCQQTSILKNGTAAFYNMAEDSSLWHDTSAVKSILRGSMNVYSSVKEIPPHPAANNTAKAAADEIAKRISNLYAQDLREHKVGIKEETAGKNTANWDAFLRNSKFQIQGGIASISFRTEDLLKLIPGWQPSTLQQD